MNAPRVAIIHDWLYVYSGAEKVLEQLLDMYPQADLFSLIDFLPEGERGFLGGRTPRTTFVQKLPGARKHFRKYLAFLPLAIEQLDLTGYDIVISSSHAAAKGVLTGPDQVHVSYVHSPMRWAWDLQHLYLAESRLDRGLKSWLARAILHYLRNWDYRTAAGVDRFVANSDFIGRRIRRAYRRDSVTVYPPVDVGSFTLETRKKDYYVSASRMVPYKRIPLIVEAFAGMPDKTLLVAGTGPDLERVRTACPPNVKLMGYMPAADLVRLLQEARAMVFAAEEDFGIAPVEAQACGTPVIAYGRGGVLESVCGTPGDGRTGVFFESQTVASIQGAVRRFEALSPAIRPEACRAQAERFSAANFRQGIARVVDDAWQALLDESGLGAVRAAADPAAPLRAESPSISVQEIS